MKVTGQSGWLDRTRRSSSYALVLIIGLLAIMAILAGALVPDMVRRSVLLKAEDEHRRLEVIANGLLDYIKRVQVIPDETNWVVAVAQETGLNEVEVAQTWTGFPAGANTERIYLIHPSLTPRTGSGLLPYQQGELGVSVGSTNSPTLNSRIMILSNTRRELSFPVSSGVISAGQFDAIWDWLYDPLTKSAPSGWPAVWSGKGDGLQVQRLSLASYFHVMTLKNLRYSVNGSALQTVTSEVQRQFLRGSLIQIYSPASVLDSSRVINREEAFDLSTTGISNFFNGFVP